VAVSDAQLPLNDPLPHARLIAAPATGGSIKERPEDFLVDELPLYEPCGEGEHLYLRVQKRNVAHNELMSILQQHYKVGEAAIGFAGMKDKVGVTQQTVSIHLPDREKARADTDVPTHSRLQFLWTARHANKLRRGHLVGNRFLIRIRKVDPLKAPAVHRQLTSLLRTGVPDYYGFQRFGYRRNNHRLGLHVLRGEWTALLDELLGLRGSASPSHQRERREFYDAGQYAESAPLWTRNDRAERVAIGVLRRGAAHREAVLAIGRTTLSFWVSALQSYIFNEVLDRRINAGLLDQLLEGDLAWKHDSRRCFPIDAAELANPELGDRLQAFEISPSGPLPGSGMLTPGGEALRNETEVMAANGLAPELFEQGPFATTGSRRPLRVQITNLEVDSGFDEHGPYIRVAFDLPRGAYATVVLREAIGAGAEGGDVGEEGRG